MRPFNRRKRHRFYRCRSPKCGYAWQRVGDVWYGPYPPYTPGDSSVIMFWFGDYYAGVAGKHTKKEVQEWWSDCWPLVELNAVDGGEISRRWYSSLLSFRPWYSRTRKRRRK